MNRYPLLLRITGILNDRRRLSEVIGGDDTEERDAAKARICGSKSLSLPCCEDVCFAMYF